MLFNVSIFITGTVSKIYNDLYMYIFGHALSKDQLNIWMAYQRSRNQIRGQRRKYKENRSGQLGENIFYIIGSLNFILSHLLYYIKSIEYKINLKIKNIFY